jgi:hypothetical protein
MEGEASVDVVGESGSRDEDASGDEGTNGDGDAGVDADDGNREPRRAAMAATTTSRAATRIVGIRRAVFRSGLR